MTEYFFNGRMAWQKGQPPKVFQGRWLLWKIWIYTPRYRYMPVISTKHAQRFGWKIPFSEFSMFHKSIFVSQKVNKFRVNHNMASTHNFKSIWIKGSYVLINVLLHTADLQISPNHDRHNPLLYRLKTIVFNPKRYFFTFAGAPIDFWSLMI